MVTIVIMVTRDHREKKGDNGQEGTNSVRPYFINLTV